jgi:hypothetical protein
METDNVYVIPVDMSDKPASEWSEEDVRNVAYQAAMKINDLINGLIEERNKTERKGDV